ncbi:MATE family efflux transporter [Chitinilyticum litopenaei]|uniref:MATE family efflux transporter n=1 Tax=Chitinilyticum litopenaei TaxID=1121276 RepID=UPI00041DE324|nr:MATE family efflux transporter [Chitinilyticum litopenaei]
MPFSRRLADTRQTWTLAWPLIISQLAGTGMAFIDAAMAGHASAADLAVVSVGASLWITALVTMMGLLLAISPLVAHKVGAGKADAIPHLVQQALWQGMAIGVLFLIAFQFIGPWVYPHLGLETEVADKASQFLMAVGWGMPGLAIQRVLGNYSTAINESRPVMVIALLTLLLNIPLNWIFVYGHLGAPAMGGVGCGVASSICAWIGAIAAMLWVWKAPAYRATQPFCNWIAPHWATQLRLLKLGLPIGATFLIEVSCFAGVALLLAPLGTTTVAAHQIALNLTSLMFMIPLGLGSALTVRVGQALGAGLPDEARFIGNTGLMMGLLIAASGALLLSLGGYALSGLYTSAEPVRRLAAQLLVFAAIFQLFDASQAILAGILRGYKITRGPMIAYILAFWLVGLPLGYALTYGWPGWAGWGAPGYWLALVLALAIIALALWWLFARVARKADGVA